MTQTFQRFTAILMLCLGMSAFLHVALLASDSPEYRAWVKVQILLQLFGLLLLWWVRKFSKIALSAFALLSVAFFAINATYVNYGNGAHLFLFAILFWGGYGYLIYGVRGHFMAGGATPGNGSA